MSTGEPQDPGQPGEPADVPADRPAALAPLDALAGAWEVEASFDAGYFGPGTPPVTERGGRTTFEWLAGKYFLIQRFTVEHPAAPSGIAIIGTGEAPGTLSQHYYDSRGVARSYGMSLDQGVWKLWRDAPGFCQRFTGIFTPGGKVIDGVWEKSADGSDWQHDFRLTYRKLA